MSPNLTQRGFTLVELLVAVTIVGILAGIAVPSWRSTMAKAHRSQARQTLVAASQWLENQYAVRNSYCPPAGCSVSPLPASLRSVPKSGTAAYGIVVANLTDNGFELRAVPAAGGPMTSDVCGTLSIDSIGRRSQTGTPSDPGACWPR